MFFLDDHTRRVNQPDPTNQGHITRSHPPLLLLDMFQGLPCGRSRDRGVMVAGIPVICSFRSDWTTRIEVDALPVRSRHQEN